MSDSPTHHQHRGESFGALTLAALGVVFGDIGTSPLYTLKECALHARQHTGGILDREDLFGILSLIFWAMTLVVTVKYLFFIMRADNDGEGGIFALLALVPKRMRTTERGQVQWLALLAIAGAALLYGDGMITPAISVLGAVEGIAVYSPGLAHWVVPITCVILIGLFAVQSQGTGLVGKLFGPVMVVWFVTIGLLGIYHISHDPHILTAMFPHHAYNYFAHHGWGGFTILASVVLAVTGGEALYADMGHFGLKPIRAGWFLAFPSLLLNYFGQGALIDRDLKAAANPFYNMVPQGPANIALVLLASLAAVIASQALISAAFSLTRQAIQLGFFPRMRVRHTAHDMEGQIYIPEINLLLAAGCLMLVLGFKTSSNLAAAYGIAVTGTMVITSLMYYVIVRETWGWSTLRALPLLLFFLALDLPFLAANLTKFFAGGYVPVLIALAFAAVMVIWNRGRTLVAERHAKRFARPEWAKEAMDSSLAARVPGTAVFMTSNPRTIPPILVHYVTRSRSLHETVILVSVQFGSSPTVPDDQRVQVSREPETGFWRVVMTYGFMEEPHLMDILTKASVVHNIPYDPAEAVYFLGRENFIATSRGHMGVVEENIFAFLSRNTLAADSFFGLPPRQVVEIGTQIDL